MNSIPACNSVECKKGFAADPAYRNGGLKEDEESLV